MQPTTGLVIDFFSHRSGETDDIVIERAFEFLLAAHERGEIGEAFLRAGLHFSEVGLGHNALSHKGLAGVHFDLQPEVEFVFVSPNCPHLGA